MQCLAGLWWDQQRRICVLPSEVACNPYNIINSQGQGPPIIDINPNSKIFLFFFLYNKYLYLVLQPSTAPPPPAPPATTPINSFPQAPVQPVSGINIKMNIIEWLFFCFRLGFSGILCRGVPLCIDVGLNILQQMKAIPGRSGWLYVFSM